MWVLYTYLIGLLIFPFIIGYVAKRRQIFDDDDEVMLSWCLLTFAWPLFVPVVIIIGSVFLGAYLGSRKEQ